MNNTSETSRNFVFSSEIPWTVAYFLQLFVSIVGNVLILWIIYKDNRLKSTTNYLVANMAVSDLLAALIAIPNQVTDYMHILGNAICKLVPFALNGCFIVSIYSCVFIAIDRYYAVAHPFGRHFHRKIKYIIAGIWIWTSVLNAPQLYFYGIVQIGNHSLCLPFKNVASYEVYEYFLLSAASGLSYVFIMITYTLTVYKLYRHKAPGLPNSAVRRREQQNKKVLKMAVTVVALLFLCQATAFINSLLLNGGQLDHLSPQSKNNLGHAIVFVIYFSLCYNLLVYLAFNNIYRENMKAMISKCFHRCGLNGININENRTVPGPSAVIEMTEINTTVNMQSDTP